MMVQHIKFSLLVWSEHADRGSGGTCIKFGQALPLLKLVWKSGITTNLRNQYSATVFVTTDTKFF